MMPGLIKDAPSPPIQLLKISRKYKHIKHTYNIRNIFHLRPGLIRDAPSPPIQLITISRKGPFYTPKLKAGISATYPPIQLLTISRKDLHHF